MPLISGNSDVYAVDLLATSANYPVKTNIVLKCIGAGDIVVVAVEEPNGDAGGLINVSRNWFELY